MRWVRTASQSGVMVSWSYSSSSTAAGYPMRRRISGRMGLVTGVAMGGAVGVAVPSSLLS